MTDYDQHLVQKTNSKFKYLHGNKTKRVGKKKIRAPKLEISTKEYTTLEEFYAIPTWIVAVIDEPEDVIDDNEVVYD